MLTEDEMRGMFRDMMVALDVGKKAELGYFDVEILTYGCAFLAKGERNYLLSSDAVNIYDFLENAVLENVYPTFLEESFFKKPLPKGFKDLIMLDLKKDMAKLLQSKYSEEFLRDLKLLAEEMVQNTAAVFLDEYMDTLVCTFDRLQFDLFEGALLWAVNHKKLELKDYYLLLGRLQEERSNLSDELRAHDVFNQTFYAAVFEQGDERKFIYDARKEAVYQKKYALESEGKLVSPVIQEVCFYNYEYRLADARRDFINRLSKTFHDGYWQLLRDIKRLPAKLTAAEFAERADVLSEKYGEQVKKTVKMYACRWDIR